MVNQVRKFLICLVISFSFSIKSSASDCPVDKVEWQKIDVSSKLKLLFDQNATIDASCFCNVLAAMATDSRKSAIDSLALFVTKWAEFHEFTTQVLFSCYRNENIHKKFRVWSVLLSEWRKENGAVDEEFKILLKNGMHAQADTLFMIFDAEGQLDFQDWFQWANVKSLIGDYGKIAELYCKSVQREPQVAEDAFFEFGRLVQELEPQVAENVLQQFSECSLAKTDVDSQSVLSWLADTYLKLGLFKQEINTLRDMRESGFPVAARSLESARSRLSLHKYRDAIEASIISYNSTDRIALKSMAAAILYKSYLNLGIRDSAFQWINLADLGSDKNRIEAITFYQSIGDFSSAAQLIDSMAPTQVRDTLIIRQFLLQSDLKKAFSFISNTRLPINREIRISSLWKSRILLFSGKVDELASYLDTIEVEPFWDCADELITYQYWLQLLGSSTEALAAWVGIEYNLYIGSFNKIMQVFSKKNIPAEYSWQLALHASKGCLKNGQYYQALLLLKMDSGAKVSPEFLYYKAVAFYRNGENDTARNIFNKLILEHSSDMFSDKARVFLNKHGLVKK